MESWKVSKEFELGGVKMTSKVEEETRRWDKSANEQIGYKASWRWRKNVSISIAWDNRSGEEAVPFVILITFFRANSNLHPRDGSPYLNPPRRFDELDSIRKDNERLFSFSSSLCLRFFFFSFLISLFFLSSSFFFFFFFRRHSSPLL